MEQTNENYEDNNYPVHMCACHFIKYYVICMLKGQLIDYLMICSQELSSLTTKKKDVSEV
jgi:hypothetical protein